MKKWYRIRFAAAFFLLCACFCAGCGEGSRPQKLDLGQLQNENASYGLPSLPFGQSVADAEKSLGCSLGEIALSNNGMDTYHIEDGWEYDGLLLDANLELGENGFASISFTVSESDEGARPPGTLRTDGERAPGSLRRTQPFLRQRTGERNELGLGKTAALSSFPPVPFWRAVTPP